MNIECAKQEAREILEIATGINGFEDFILGKNENFDVAQLFNKGIEYNCGCTKHVFWLKYGKYVFKVDICEDFSYCEKEYEIYKEAKKEGIGDLFAEISYIGDIFGKKAYAMEYAHVSDDDVENDYYIKNSNSGMSENEIIEMMDDMNSEDVVLDLFKFYYPHNIIKVLNKFIQKNQINDFHPGNVGYINNRLVFIDYSGY